jgi:hypothetical protein
VKRSREASLSESDAMMALEEFDITCGEFYACRRCGCVRQDFAKRTKGGCLIFFSAAPAAGFRTCLVAGLRRDEDRMFIAPTTTFPCHFCWFGDWKRRKFRKVGIAGGGRHFFDSGTSWRDSLDTMTSTSDLLSFFSNISF